MCPDAQGGKDSHMDSLVTCSPRTQVRDQIMQKTMAPSHILIFKQKIIASYTPLFTSLCKKVQHQLAYLSSLQSCAFQGLIVLTSLIWSSDTRSAVCMGNSACHVHKLPRYKARKDQNNCLRELSPLYIAFSICS